MVAGNRPRRDWRREWRIVPDLRSRLDKLEGVGNPQIHLIALDRADETEAEALARRPAPPGARVVLIDTGIYRSGS